MLFISIDMWPRGEKDKGYVLGEAVIANIGGTESMANYKVWLSKKGGFKQQPKELGFGPSKNVWKETVVVGYNRKRYQFWYLIAKATY